MPDVRCACPRDDARDCIRWRYKDDMREHLGDEPICGPDDECECACHERDEDDDLDDGLEFGGGPEADENEGSV